MNIIKTRKINIKINILFVVFLLIYIYFGYCIEILVIVTTILIHELSHNIAAIKFGAKIKEIEIYPFGGMAKFDNLNITTPQEEIIICTMGPLCNLVLAIIFLGLNKIFTDIYLINYTLKINFLMLLINITPIFPLDGGKIVRAIISIFIGYKAATIKLTYITYTVCTFIIIYDIFNWITGNITYFSTIAVFTIIAAKREKDMAAFVFIKSITGKPNDLKKKKRLKVHLQVCTTSTLIKEAIECFLPNRYHIFIIINMNGETIGTLTEVQLIEGIYKFGLDITLEDLLMKIKKI